MNHEALRREILVAARDGRAELLPAGARNNQTALILIDGEMIGQAASLGHYVFEAPNASQFGLRKLIPAPEYVLASLPWDVREGTK